MTFEDKSTQRYGSLVVITLLLLAAVFVLPSLQSISYAQNGQQAITQIASQAAEAVTGSEPGEIQQAIRQIATQTANAGGDSNQAISQIGLQVASDPGGPVSQSLAQFAQQIAAGNTEGVTQSINQVALQVTRNGPALQQLIQNAIQLATGTPNVN